MTRLWACAVGVGLVALAVARGASGQSGATVSRPSSDELVTEVRALRADLTQRLDASIRAQLLVARLQLQEQRIGNVARELQRVEEHLRDNEQARAPLEGQVKAFESQAKESDSKEMDIVVGPLRNVLDQIAKTDADLKQQQAHLSGLLAEEQSRWTTFNSRLEELERLIAARPPR